MTDYKRTQREFDFTCHGVDLNTPVDKIRKKGKYPILKNVICTTDGIIECRPGCVDRYSVYTPIANKTPFHSARRLNDSSTGSLQYAVIYGVQDVITMEKNASGVFETVTAAMQGFSGNPLTMAPYRPRSSPRPFMYIGDSSKMVKVDVNNNVYGFGLPAPLQKPEFVQVGQAAYRTVDLFESAAGWAASAGSVGAAASRVTTTVLATAADGGSVFAVRPASMANIGVGTILTTNVTIGSEDLMVLQVNKGSVATQISQIVYEDTGLICYLTLTTPLKEAQPGSMIQNTSLGGYGYVNAVNTGLDGTISLEVLANNALWQSGHNIQLHASFVVRTSSSSQIPTGNITSNEVPFTTAASGSSKFSKTVALDLSTFNSQGVTTGVSNQAYDSDYMHISLNVDKPDLVSEIKIYIDVDQTTNNFTKNYYVYSISPSDFTPVTKSTQSALDNRQTQVRRRLLDRDIRPRSRMIDEGGPGGAIFDPSGGLFSDPSDEDPTAPSRNQLQPGDNQFSEIMFQLSSMTKVGADTSRGLGNVAAIQIEVITTGVVVVQADSWIIRGGHPLDSTDLAIPYRYAYRYRGGTTGAVSALSPASTQLVYPRRQSVTMTLLGASAVTYPEITKIDVFRMGGTLDDWCYVGSTASTGGTFTDILSDIAARQIGDAAGTFNSEDPDRQPWVILDTPKSGTISVLAGTVATSSAQFDPAWCVGNEFIVNGVPTTITRVHSSSKIEFADHIGTGTNLPWECKSPYKVGQPLLVFGPEREYIFGFGDLLNPGTLYYAKPKNPDSHNIRRSIELVGGSERIQNGFTFNGRVGVFTSERLFYLDYQPLDSDGPWIPHQSPGVKGLYARWAMAISPHRGVAWLAQDGLFLINESGVHDLITEDLQPLFPLGGHLGTDTNGVSAPQMPATVGAEEKWLRLAFGDDDSLYFTYRDSGTNLKCLRYDFDLEAWFPYTYGKPVAFFYEEEGPGVRNLIAGSAESPQAHLYTIGGAADNGTDAGTAISCQVRTPSYDFDDPRSEKQIGDIEVDIDPGGATISVQPGFDNHSTTVAATSLSGSGRISPPTVIDLNAGSGQFARNVSLDISWSNGVGQKPKLYLWQPAVLDHPEQSLLRATDYEFTKGALLYVRGFWIDAMTVGGTRSLTIDYIDHTGALQTYVINNIAQANKSKVFYPVTTPFYCSTMRFRPTDANKWRLYGVEPVGDPAPEFSTDPSQFTDDGEIGNKFLQGGVVDIDTHGVGVQLQIQGDAGAVLYTTPAITTALRSPVAFALNPAKQTHLMRIVPLGNCHIFGVKWFWQHEAELAAYYESQSITGQLPGWKHAREVYVAYYGAANPLTLSITTDLGAIAGIPALPASSGYTRSRILLPARKFKWIQMSLSSTTAFGLDRDGTEISIKGYGKGGDYQVWKPFGFVRADRGVVEV